MAVTDAQIKNALGDRIQEAINLLYTGANPSVDVRIHRHWILSSKIGENAAIMTALTGRDKGKVHAWMIGASQIKRVRPDVKDDFDGMANRGMLKKVGPNRRDLVKTYRVWAAIQYDGGQVGTDEVNNSENALITELEAVSDYLSNSPTLGITDLSLQGHTDLQVDNIDTFSFGQTMVSLAQCSISVYLYKPIA